MNQFRRQLAALLLLIGSGCALLTGTTPDMSGPKTQQTLRQTAEGSPDGRVPVRNVVRLATSIMTAPDTDRRIRELVWEELDESGLMSPEDRRRLNQSGLRVGVSGSALPWALTSLQQNGRHHKVSVTRNRAAAKNHSAFGTEIVIPDGGRSIIELPGSSDQMTIPPEQLAGLHDGAELTRVRRILELTPVEYGNGWVVIRFLPQIHHGAVTTRFNISGNGQTMPVRQKIQPLYEQQFQLKLHVNETVVIGHQKQDKWTVGRILFQSDHLTSTTESLVAVQLTAIEKVKGEKSLHVDYGKY